MYIYYSLIVSVDVTRLNKKSKRDDQVDSSSPIP